MSSIHTSSDLNLCVCMYRVNRNCIDGRHCIDDV